MRREIVKLASPSSTPLAGPAPQIEEHPPFLDLSRADIESDPLLAIARGSADSDKERGHHLSYGSVPSTSAGTESGAEHDDDEITRLYRAVSLSPRTPSSGLPSPLASHSPRAHTAHNALNLDHLRPRTVGTLQLAVWVFLCVNGGPYGVEEVVASTSPFVLIAAIFLVPWLWCFPVALVTAELSTAYTHSSALLCFYPSASLSALCLSLSITHSNKQVVV